MNEIHSLKTKIEELTSDIKIKKEYILDEINYAEPSKYPRKDHPRVWLDKERLEVIKQNLLSPENKYAYADYINKSEMSLPEYCRRLRRSRKNIGITATRCLR